MERNIITCFGGDFNFVTPISHIERYFHLLDIEDEIVQEVKQLAVQICVIQLIESKFLRFRQSQMTACAILISYNIIKKDQAYAKLKLKNDGRSEQEFPLQFGRIGLFDFDASIWNNSKVVTLTGYSFNQLKKCLKMLAINLKAYYNPDRLLGIDIDSIEDIIDISVQKRRHRSVENKRQTEI